MTHKKYFVKSLKGFTLIELLVVIAIIGLLSSVIIAPIQSSRKKARDAQRISSLDSIRTALTIYYDDNGSYPVVTLGSDTSWRSQCASWGGYANNAVVPGLVPNYLPRLPTDPLNKTPGDVPYCYLYRSNGYEYKMLLYVVTESNAPIGYIDAPRPGPHWSICDGATACAW